MVIPRGARNIRVEEVAESTNFLALMDPSGHYYLNGGWDIKWSGKYEAAGTVVRYERDDQNKETFEAKGPLEEPLHVMVRNWEVSVVGGVHAKALFQLIKWRVHYTGRLRANTHSKRVLLL